MKDNKRSVGKCNKFQKKGVSNLDAKVDSCCAWMSQSVLIHKKVIQKGNNTFCGIDNVGWGNLRGVCCLHERKDSIGDCDAFNWPKGPAFDYILKFGTSEEEFYK